MGNLRGLLGIRRMDRVPNARIRELCGVTKEVGERIDEGVCSLVLQAIWRGWRMLGLLRESMWENVMVVAQLVRRGRDGLIPWTV